MEQSDQFYQQLPFTLQEEHMDSEYLIFGTGLQQSALAAYLAKIQDKKVLVFDQQKTYGSCLKTITLKQLVQLSQNKLHQRLYEFHVPSKYKQLNQNFYNDCLAKKASRGYNIDIQPSVFFGNSITCQSLKQADMDKYMDFRLVNHLLKYQKGKLQQVPLSKGKIFESKNLTLSQKKTLLTSLHTLIKLYQKHANIEEDQNSTKQFDKGFGQVSEELFNYFKDNLQENFVGLLEKITKKNKKIMNFIAYIVCNYQYSYSNTVANHAQQSFKVKNFIQRFGKFINSCGIYGQSPYLYVDNGMGDIPQAFSRIASIFGSTFILHPKLTIDSIEENEEFVTIKSNIVPGKQLKVKKVFYGQTFEGLFRQNNKKVFLQKQEILRVLVLCKKLGNEEQCPTIGYFLDLQQFKNPVCFFMFDESTHTCPSGYVLYQFSTILGKDSQALSAENRQQYINQKTQILIEKIAQIRGGEFSGSIRFMCSYIRRSNIEVEEAQKKEPQVQSKQVLLKGYGGLDLDYHFQNFIKIVGKKDNYFRKKNPYQNDEQEDSDEQNTNNILYRLDNIKIDHKETTNVSYNTTQNQPQYNLAEAESLQSTDEIKNQNKQINHTLNVQNNNQITPVRNSQNKQDLLSNEHNEKDQQNEHNA